MIMLVFGTEGLATAATAQIKVNIGLNTGAGGKKTAEWDIPSQRATDGKWFFAKPEERYMSGVHLPYTEEEYEDNWRPE